MRRWPEFPKEHGAYGQLIIPLATALIVGRRTAPALMLGAAAVLAFLAHEPLLVRLGQRGTRAARDQRSRASVWFASTAIPAALLAVGALAIASPVVRAAAIGPAALAALLAGVIAGRREHTIGGEALAAATFAALSFPVARAAGVSMHAALSCASAFAGLFIASTVCVHAVIEHARDPPAAVARATGAIAAAGSVAVLWWMARSGVVSTVAPMAAAPGCAIAALAALVGLSARRLRLLGWTLVAMTIAGALLLVLVLG